MDQATPATPGVSHPPSIGRIEVTDEGELLGALIRFQVVARVGPKRLLDAVSSGFLQDNFMPRVVF